ncbi:MAG: hypothetical protein ACOC29_03285, partial [Candidatus Sumerlaeota bacterium]
VRPQVEEFANKLFTDTGVDLLSDFSEIAIAGYFDKSRKQDGLVFLRGHLDDHFISNLIGNLPSYTKETQGGRTVHGFWSDKDSEMRYACMLDKEVFVLGRYEAVVAAAKLTAGEGKGMIADSDYAKRCARIPSSAVAAAVALPPEKMPADRGQRFVGEKIKAAAAWIDGGTTLEWRLEITSLDDEHARQSGEMLEGVVALGQMAARRPLLRKLLKTTTVAVEESSVITRFTMATDEVSDVLSALQDLKQERR